MYIELQQSSHVTIEPGLLSQPLKEVLDSVEERRPIRRDKILKFGQTGFSLP